MRFKPPCGWTREVVQLVADGSNVDKVDGPHDGDAEHGECCHAKNDSCAEEESPKDGEGSVEGHGKEGKWWLRERVRRRVICTWGPCCRVPSVGANQCLSPK
jgi:hypothetical protein